MRAGADWSELRSGREVESGTLSVNISLRGVFGAEEVRGDSTGAGSSER